MSGGVVTLSQAVAELPDTAEGIAAMLREAGIRGTHNCNTCPLAVWLVRRTGECLGVSKNHCWVEPWNQPSSRVGLPAAAYEFVYRFDATWPVPGPNPWPELEAAS